MTGGNSCRQATALDHTCPHPICAVLPERREEAHVLFARLLSGYGRDASLNMQERKAPGTASITQLPGSPSASHRAASAFGSEAMDGKRDILQLWCCAMLACGRFQVSLVELKHVCGLVCVKACARNPHLLQWAAIVCCYIARVREHSDACPACITHWLLTPSRWSQQGRAAICGQQQYQVNAGISARALRSLTCFGCICCTQMMALAHHTAGVATSRRQNLGMLSSRS